MTDLMIKNFLNQNDWSIVDEQTIPAKTGKFFKWNDLTLSQYSYNYLNKKYEKGIYKHQKACIEEFVKGNNVCISTSTSSGKTLAFQICAIEELVKNPNSRIIAVYPLKALGTEQEQRWVDAFEEAGLDIKVGRIDGSVHTTERFKIMEESRLLIMTPDVIHAWLLSSGILSKSKTKKFLSGLSTLIIDETHVYSGVFGSHSAYLYRRLNHLSNLLGKDLKYIAASATIKNPEKHLSKLTGKHFKIIDSKYDTSAKEEMKIIFVEPPKVGDQLANIVEIMKYLALETEHKFITFADSRKQTSYIAAIASRENNNLLLPYRSGYEESDRLKIQNQLTQGNLKGVISTSALEMGLDIPHLTLGVLIGIPSSKTSLYQRIGRVGRHGKGTVIIINDGSFSSRNIFRNPKELFNLPLSESALYLENKKIQYIHALCLAREEGEHDIIGNTRNSEFSSKVPFPDNFIKMCNSERVGEIDSECSRVKLDGGDDPNKIYLLRDLEIQYKVISKRGLEVIPLGTLSFSQVMREAYPGAVYYYLNDSYRVVKVNRNDKTVEVKKEKKYFTKPNFLPTNIYPNLTQENIHEAVKYGDLFITECALSINESIVGYKENKGSQEDVISYPLPYGYDRKFFSRYLTTTGVIFSHPIMQTTNVYPEAIAEVLFEAFLLTIPFERHDVNYGNDKYRSEKASLHKGDKFVCIFDQTYGSLRLTSRLMKKDILLSVFEKAVEISEKDLFSNEISPETIEAIKVMKEELSKKEENIIIENEEIIVKENRSLIIMPGSSGVVVTSDNQEFFITKVFMNNQGLVYRGAFTPEDIAKNNLVTMYPTSKVQPIPGKSILGEFDYELGEAFPLESESIAA